MNVIAQIATSVPVTIRSRRILSWIIVAVLVLAGPPLAYGWGARGHELVGDVADHYLTEKTREAVKKLLGDRTLADVASWADHIKGERPETRPWHYANTPPGAESFDLERDCPEESCVVEQINLDVAVLKNPEATHVDKVQALMFLVHFVGDCHQPLHLGYEADRGGNSIDVSFIGSKTNLHALWDSGLINHAQLDREEHHKGLLTMSTRPKRAEWARVLDPEEWATESYRLAVSNAYVVPNTGRLSETYYRRNMPVVNERLAAAGVRLAALLNSIYDPIEPLFAAPPDGAVEIVYAIGIPGVNKPTEQYRYQELSKAINALTEEQHFTVIFYQKDRQLEPPPIGTSGKPATVAVKKRVMKWLDPEAKNIVDLTRYDPMETLRQALRYKPDVVYFWTDKLEGRDLNELLGEIDRLNVSNAVINTIQYSINPAEEVRRDPGTPELIAEHTGGVHRFYGGDDLKGH